MIDKRIKMDCPFCHTPANQIQIHIWSSYQNFGQIYCPKCGCKFEGTGKQNLIDKWNCR